MRASVVAVVSLVSAVVGAVAALGIGKAAGWVDDTETVVVSAPRPQRGEPAPAVLRSPAKPLVGSEFDPARIYATRANGVVTIYAFFGEAEDPTANAQGSGFVVSPKGYVLTNSHVITTAGEASPGGRVMAARDVFVQYKDGDRARARIVGWDPFTDVGVLRVNPKEHPLSPVPLGDSARVVVGEPVAAIGSPFGNVSSLVVGVVSATHRSIASLTSRYSVVDAIQTDAPINRGNSGGPLFDARGRVIGINAQIRSESGRNEGVGFAIPINTARRSLDQLVRTGRVSYACIGVEAGDLTPSIARRFDYAVSRGAVLTAVKPGSPAMRAGLRGGTRTVEFEGLEVSLGGDVIVGINGRRVRGADDVVRIVSSEVAPGDTVVFDVVRGGRRIGVAVRAGARERESQDCG